MAVLLWNRLSWLAVSLVHFPREFDSYFRQSYCFPERVWLECDLAFLKPKQMTLGNLQTNKAAQRSYRQRRQYLTPIPWELKHFTTKRFSLMLCNFGNKIIILNPCRQMSLHYFVFLHNKTSWGLQTQGPFPTHFRKEIIYRRFSLIFFLIIFNIRAIWGGLDVDKVLSSDWSKLVRNHRSMPYAIKPKISNSWPSILIIETKFKCSG